MDNRTRHAGSRRRGLWDSSAKCGEKREVALIAAHSPSWTPRGRPWWSSCHASWLPGLGAPSTAATAFLAGLLGAAPTQAQFLPTPLDQVMIPSQTSADSVSNFIFTAPQKGLYSLTIKTGASAGYLMVFDATALPSDGAVTSCTSSATTRPCLSYCIPINSASFAGVQWFSPLLTTSGIVAAFSTTGCDTLTVSATAKFTGQTL